MDLRIGFRQFRGTPSDVSARRVFHGFALASLLSLAACGSSNNDDHERYPHADEPIASVREVYDGALTPELAVNTFRNIDRLFPTRVIEPGGNPYPLPPAERQLTDVSFSQGEGAQRQDYDLESYLELNRVAGLLVIKDGKVAYETYRFGNSEQTRWMSMSIAKSITSTLIGAALVDGYIGSLEDPVTQYVPALAGSSYEGVTVGQILTMTSGVKWNETYTDPTSDRRALLEAQIAQEPGAALDVMRALPRAAAPGTLWNYSTGETQVAGEIVRGAVGRPLADYLSEKIWQPFGMEAEANWWLDSPDGVEIGGSGISATLRDYARFGLFFLNGGVAAGEQVVPPGWTSVAGKPVTLGNGSTIPYGYMWWPGWTEAAIADQAFTAIGIFGQWIYINPRHNVVIAKWGAETKPEGDAPIDDLVFFDAVAKALE